MPKNEQKNLIHFITPQTEKKENFAKIAFHKNMSQFSQNNLYSGNTRASEVAHLRNTIVEGIVPSWDDERTWKKILDCIPDNVHEEYAELVACPQNYVATKLAEILGDKMCYFMEEKCLASWNGKEKSFVDFF